MIAISHVCFIDHSQYYQGCSFPTVLGVGSTPYEALDDALEAAAYLFGDDLFAMAALRAYRNDEPDELGELGDIPGAMDDFSEVRWHCELTVDDRGE